MNSAWRCTCQAVLGFVQGVLIQVVSGLGWARGQRLCLGSDGLKLQHARLLMQNPRQGTSLYVLNLRSDTASITSAVPILTSNAHAYARARARIRTRRCAHMHAHSRMGTRTCGARRIAKVEHSSTSQSLAPPHAICFRGADLLHARALEVSNDPHQSAEADVSAAGCAGAYTPSLSEAELQEQLQGHAAVAERIDNVGRTLCAQYESLAPAITAVLQEPAY
eukprot:6175068-Pleurochrysis_carterae.AAC.3